MGLSNFSKTILLNKKPCTSIYWWKRNHSGSIPDTSTMTRLEKNIEQTIKLLRIAEPKEGYFLAFSGGKDSIVLYDITKKANVKFDAHYSVTGIDPKEIIPFIRKNYPDMNFIKPKKSMYQLVIDKQMLPTRLARFCCESLKEGAGDERVVLTGVRWAESSKRKNERTFIDFDYNMKKLVMNPIINWTDKQVWEYIRSNNLQYPSLYDKGYKRIGCIACPMMGAKKQRQQLKDNPHIRKMYVRAINKTIELKPDCYFSKFKDADEIISWWTSGKSIKEYNYILNNQTTLFQKGYYNET